MTLFEIETAIGQALNNLTVDEETGEVKGYEELEKLQADKQEKIENIGKYIINLDAEAKALEEQEKKFAKRKQSAKKKAEYLKGLLSKPRRTSLQKHRNSNIVQKEREPAY